MQRCDEMQNLINHIRDAILHKSIDLKKNNSKDVRIVKVSENVWQFIWADDYKNWRKQHSGTVQQNN